MTGNPYLWVVGAIALLAAALLIMGIRGKRSPPRRVCRRCKYEVGEQAVCPECGRDLGRRGGRGARIVRRRPRRGLVWSGVGVGAALVVIAGTLGILVARGVNLNTYKPFEVLLLEVRIGDARTAGAAAEELWKRRMSLFDPMGDGRADRVLAAALRIHANTDRPWPGMLSGFIDEAMLAGRMTPPQVQRYFDNIASPRLLLPQGPPPRAGVPISLDLDQGWRAGPFRSGRRMAMGVSVSIRLEEPEPDSARLRFRALIGLPQPEPPLVRAVELDIPTDAEVMRVAGVVRFEPTFSEFSVQYPEVAKYVGVVTAVERRVELVFDVAPPPTIEITSVTSPEMQATMLEAIRPTLTRSGDTVLIRFERHAIPAPLYARVAVQDPVSGQEWETVAPLTADREIGLYAIAADSRGLSVDVVNLVIRPWPEGLRQRLLAERSDATATIFGDELILRDVPLRPYEAPTAGGAPSEGDASPRRGRRQR